MRYSDFAIEQTKKWLSETAMKNSTPKRLAGHLYEAAGEDLDCLQLSAVCDGIGYVAVDDTEEDEITVSLDSFEEV